MDSIILLHVFKTRQVKFILVEVVLFEQVQVYSHDAYFTAIGFLRQTIKSSSLEQPS
jgi:hypothetical protein